jgi:NADPH:quinone reductase-like Zn-dependent oxidoreductase
MWYMKSYHANKGAGLASLVVKEHDIPVPGPHEVLVRVRANSLNYRDLLILRGTYPTPIRPDVIPLCDGAGEIVAIGSDVSRARIGDRVVGVSRPKWIDGPFGLEYATQLSAQLHGLLTEYAVLHEEWIVHIPDHLSFEEAATLPCAAVVAWNALTGGQPLLAGNTVLIPGSSSVSLFALQFARLFGARVIATTSSEEKVQRLKTLGADEVINYRMTPDWPEAVHTLTNGRGVDQVVESNGAGTLEQSIKATAISGQVSIIGGFPVNVSKIDFYTFFSGLVTLRPIVGGSRAHFLAMNRAITQGRLKPVVDRVFPFEEAKAAYRYYEEARHFGKVIISQG